MNRTSNLEKLKIGLILSYANNHLIDKEYINHKNITNKQYIIDKRYEYSDELIRTFSELKLTIKLLSEVKDRIKLNDIIFEEPELIIYYNGIFFDLVHQIKDKLFRTIFWICQDENTKLFIKEQKNIRLSKIKKILNNKINNKSEILELLDEWSDEITNDSNIGICLRKRTHYHHNLSTLKNNKDFILCSALKFILNTGYIKSSSENKDLFNQYNKFSVSLKDDTITKLKKTLISIQFNLNKISLELIENFDISYNKNEILKTIKLFQKKQIKRKSKK